jgi:hypothetical protein
VYVGKGRRHDYRLFKESPVHLHPNTEAQVDSGFQGYQKVHEKTILPFKGTKKRPLEAAQKEHNYQLASKRIKVEHVIRRVKIFRILSERYRNRRKRFGLRVNLIAGIYNFELN